jgi:hypothetical protein
MIDMKRRGDARGEEKKRKKRTCFFLDMKPFKS